MLMGPSQCPNGTRAMMSERRRGSVSVSLGTNNFHDPTWVIYRSVAVVEGENPVSPRSDVENTTYFDSNSAKANHLETTEPSIMRTELSKSTTAHIMWHERCR